MVMRTHVALSVGNLDEAVRFYEALLQEAPSRRFPQYVQFLTPTLNLALSAHPSAEAVGPERNHFGLEVESAEAVTAAAARLVAAALPSDVEVSTFCCHSLQDKVWTQDPDGRRWEIFHVARRDEAGPVSAGAACC